MTIGAAIGLDQEREAGFALVVVLWFAIIVAAVLTPFVLAARTQALVQANLSRLDRLNLLADGLATTAVVRLANPTGTYERNVPLNSTVLSCRVGNFEVLSRFQEHRGLIDLNAASGALLKEGFEAVGLDVTIATALASAVQQYRTAGPDAELPHGLTIVGGAKGGRFQSVLELSDFSPLARIASEKLLRIFTVHSRSAVISKEWTPAELVEGNVSNLDLEPSIIARSAPSGTDTIEVAVRELGHKLTGYSGSIVSTGRILEELPRSFAEDLSLQAKAHPNQIDCRILFGTQVVQDLENFQ